MIRRCLRSVSGRLALLVGLALAAVSIAGCDDAFDGPRITDFGLNQELVDPSRDCGMSDEFFQAELLVADTEEPVVDGELILLDTPAGDEIARPDTVDIISNAERYDFRYINQAGPDDTGVVFNDIQKSWCQSLRSDESYDIEATVRLEDGSEISRTFFGALRTQ